MKNRKLILTICFFLFITLLNAAPPGPGGDPGASGGTLVGGAPIDGGLSILIGLIMAIGGRKAFLLWKKRKKGAQ